MLGGVAGVACGRVRCAAAGAWVLLAPAGAAATIGGPGGGWRALPPVPARTATLATGRWRASLDALAVAGSTLTVWQAGAGRPGLDQAQTISVPIQYGSSS